MFLLWKDERNKGKRWECKLIERQKLTRISVNESSGTSVSFAPWNLGMTSWNKEGGEGLDGLGFDGLD